MKTFKRLVSDYRNHYVKENLLTLNLMFMFFRKKNINITFLLLLLFESRVFKGLILYCLSTVDILSSPFASVLIFVASSDHSLLSYIDINIGGNNFGAMI